MLAPFSKISGRRQWPKTIKKTIVFFRCSATSQFLDDHDLFIDFGCQHETKSLPKSRSWGLWWALWVHLGWFSATCGVTFRCDCQLSDQICQLNSNLVPSWSQVGPTRPNLAATWSNLGPTWLQHGSNLAHLGSKLGPRWSNLAQDGLNLVQLVPNLLQPAPNMAPTRPDLA